MLEPSTFHAIFVEVVVGSFTLSGIAFLLILVLSNNQKIVDWSDKAAHFGLALGVIFLPLAIISGMNSGDLGGSELLAKKTVYSFSVFGLGIGLLVNRWKSKNFLAKKMLYQGHASFGIINFGLVAITGSLGGKMTRGESLLDIFGIGEFTYAAFPTWVSGLMIIIALLIILIPQKSSVKH